MPRSIYFSFHYQDVIDFRANVVRNSNNFRKSGNTFKDSSIWEEAKEKKVKVIKSLIESSLYGTSVTCVLIGNETYARRWVRFEIIKSFVDKKGILGVGINWIKDKYKKSNFWAGPNPFEYLKIKISQDGNTIYFLEYKEGWVKYKDLPEVKNTHLSKKYAGNEYLLKEFYHTYSYVWNDGKNELTNWIEKAAKNVSR